MCPDKPGSPDYQARPSLNRVRQECLKSAQYAQSVRSWINRQEAEARSQNAAITRRVMRPGKSV